MFRNKSVEFLFTLGLFAVLVMASLYWAPEGERQINSLGRTQEAGPRFHKSRLHEHEKSHFAKHTKKLSALYTVTVSPDREGDFLSGDVFGLIARVQLTQEVDRIDLKWVLPAEVEIVSGSLTETILDPKVESQYEFEVTLKSLSNENQQVVVAVENSDPSAKMGDMALFNTVGQFEMEFEKAALVERHKEYSKRQQKIFQ